MLSKTSLIIGLLSFILAGSAYAQTSSTQTVVTTTHTVTTTTTQTETVTENQNSPGPIHPHGTFIFNPKTLIWNAYAPDGTLVRSGHRSGGSNYCRDLHRRCHTPVGFFYVYGKGNASCKSSKFPIDRPGAPMPWCMYFHGGFAIHGSYEVRNYNASHGCVRIEPADAYWLSHNLIVIGTVVIIKPY